MRAFFSIFRNFTFVLYDIHDGAGSICVLRLSVININCKQKENFLIKLIMMQHMIIYMIGKRKG